MFIICCQIVSKLYKFIGRIKKTLKNVLVLTIGIYDHLYNNLATSHIALPNFEVILHRPI